MAMLTNISAKYILEKKSKKKGQIDKISLKLKLQMLRSILMCKRERERVRERERIFVQHKIGYCIALAAKPSSFFK